MFADGAKTRAASIQSETDEHAFSTTPIIIHNMVTGADNRSQSEMVGTKNVGGTVHQTYNNSTANIIGSSKSQQPKPNGKQTCIFFKLLTPPVPAQMWKSGFGFGPKQYSQNFRGFWPNVQ